MALTIWSSAPCFSPLSLSLGLFRSLFQAVRVRELTRELTELHTRIEDITARWEVAAGQDREVLGSTLIRLNGLAELLRKDLEVVRGDGPSTRRVSLKGSVRCFTSNL